MNLILHGIVEGEGDELPIACADSLRARSASQFDVVLTNPPFGVKGTVTYLREYRASKAVDELTVVRPDFWVQTSNKQLNFLQHVVTLLKPDGRAAVVLPDNVLFESGAAGMIRRRLLETCDVHTLLRLPTGLFYAQGVKANVLFFDRSEPKHLRPKRFLWVYDLRSGNRFSLKTKPLALADLDEFIQLYCSSRRDQRAESSRPSYGASRWRRFDIQALLATDHCNLDLSWSVDEPRRAVDAASRLNEISRAITEDLQRALEGIARAASPPKD